MRADAALAADLRPRPFVGALSLTGARQILMTGATGFLGSALLALVNHTNALVTCLVRTAQASRSEARSPTSVQRRAAQCFASCASMGQRSPRDN
jgi:NADPH:quinone reductase-like Zn-dependent oxidoreductase